MRALRPLLYVWAGPVSLAGLAIAGLVRASGGSVRRVEGVLEASGGILGRLFPHLWPGLHLCALTLGHVVLAEHAEGALATRRHERVHVRQYERWGFLFPLLYLLASAAALLRGGHAYRDNAFEREAFRAEGTAGPGGRGGGGIVAG